MRAWLYVAAALIVGGLAPIQGSLNGEMGKVLGHPLRGTLMNFVVGWVLLLMILVIWVGFPTREDLGRAPWHLYLAGIQGVLFVTTLLTLIPIIGALKVITAVVVGQLMVSVIIDHFGLLHVPVHSLSPGRVAGLLLLVAGIILIQRS